MICHVIKSIPSDWYLLVPHINSLEERILALEESARSNPGAPFATHNPEVRDTPVAAQSPVPNKLGIFKDEETKARVLAAMAQGRRKRSERLRKMKGTFLP